MNSKTYKLPNGKKAVFEYDVCGIGKITLECMDELMAMVADKDIVRCQDCKYWVYHFNGCSRNPCTEPWYATDFCNYGQKGDENVETD